jgi:hypothetical protein
LERAQHPARHHNGEAGYGRLERQCDREAARDDNEIMDVSALNESESELHCGAAHIHEDALTARDESGCRSADRTLCRRIATAGLLESRLSQSLGGHRAAVNSHDRAGQFERMEVSTNRDIAHVELLRRIRDPHEPARLDESL